MTRDEEEATTGGDRAIGDSVSALRGNRSQQSVADAMRKRGHKWRQATVWSVETGVRPLRLTEASDLAALLGAKLDDLLHGPGVADRQRQILELRERLEDFHMQRQSLDHAAEAIQRKLGELTGDPVPVIAMDGDPMDRILAAERVLEEDDCIGERWHVLAEDNH